MMVSNMADDVSFYLLGSRFHTRGCSRRGNCRLFRYEDRYGGCLHAGEVTLKSTRCLPRPGMLSGPAALLKFTPSRICLTSVVDKE